MYIKRSCPKIEAYYTKYGGFRWFKVEFGHVYQKKLPRGNES
jgi:hypothetical protein